MCVEKLHIRKCLLLNANGRDLERKGGAKVGTHKRPHLLRALPLLYNFETVQGAFTLQDHWTLVIATK